MPTEAPASVSRSKRTPWVGGYSGRELLKWVLDRDRLRLLYPWYDDFLKQQAEVREMYRIYSKAAKYTKAKTISVSGEFYHYARIPSCIAEIICAVDPELDGTSDQKMEMFLRDHPDFDLRVRGD